MKMPEKLESHIVNEIRSIAFKYALQNAIQYGGKAELKAVISKVIAEKPELKSVIREVVSMVRNVVNEVNRLSIVEQKRIAEEKYPEIFAKKERKEEKKLPPLPNAHKYKVIVTRFAPNPDFVLHLGNARPAILCYEYARMYKGKFILRFDDTDPKIKKPMLEAYDLIREDLKWLGLKWDEEYIQSLRLPIHYQYAKKLIELGGAYVDTCSRKEFKKLRDRRKPCPHRSQSIEKNLELWDKMLEGHFGEGEAVLRVKTDLNHPDPSVRDWVAFRIIDTSKSPHPLVRDKYIVWPTYNYASALDDHLLNITHILRAKEHLTNTVKQKYLYRHFRWEYPETIHFGKLKLKGFILSKSAIRKYVETGKFEGFDDPRFGTLCALRKRGFIAEAIRELILEVGVKPSEASISMENLAALNRKIVDPKAPRILFVDNPVKMVISGISEFTTKIPYHPEVKELGYRVLRLKSSKNELEVYISHRDYDRLSKGDKIRLLGLFNIRIEEKKKNTIRASLTSVSLEEAKKYKLQIIQWVPCENNVNVIVKKPEGLNLSIIEGVAEESLRKTPLNTIVQFYRFGFVRVNSVSRDKVITYFAHE